MKKICIFLTSVLCFSVLDVAAVHLTSTMKQVDRCDSSNLGGDKRKAVIYCGNLSEKDPKRRCGDDEKVMSLAPKIMDVKMAFNLAMEGNYNSTLLLDLAPEVRTACARISSSCATQVSSQLVNYPLREVCKRYLQWRSVDVFPGDGPSDMADANALITFILCSAGEYTKEHRLQLSFNTKGIELLLANLEKMPIKLDGIDISITFNKELTLKQDKQVELLRKVLDVVRVINCHPKTLNENLCDALCKVVPQKMNQLRPIQFTFTLSSFLTSDLRKKFLSTLQLCPGVTHFCIACPCAQLDSDLQKDVNFLMVSFVFETDIAVIARPTYAEDLQQAIKLYRTNDDQLADIVMFIG